MNTALRAWQTAGAAALAVVALLPAPSVARADDKVTLGGGAGIVVVLWK